MKIGAWVLGIAIFLLICQLLGFDIKGWIESLWDQMSAIPPGYLIAALVFQSAPDRLRRASPTTGSSAPPTRAR